MGNLIQDVRYAIRTLARSPGFTLIAIVTLALGIGANTAIFSLVHAVILKPLPFRDPSRLIAAWDTYHPETGVAQFSKIGVSPVEMSAWSEQSDLFEETGWYRYISKDLNLTAAGAEAVTIHSSFVSSRFLDYSALHPCWAILLTASRGPVRQSGVRRPRVHLMKPYSATICGARTSLVTGQ